MEVSGDRIVRATAVVPADPNMAAGTAFHGFDAFGNFWRGSTNGAIGSARNPWTTFTTEDGLVSNDCDGEAFWADSDGSVWLGTSGGLAHYRPGNGAPPGPLIASPTIARLEIEPAGPADSGGVFFPELQGRAAGAVRLPAGRGALDGLGGAEHLHQGLGPGTHRLEVRCRVRDGPFSPEIAAVPSSGWNRCGERPGGLVCWQWLCVLAAIIRFVRWRLSAAEKEQAELEAIVAARTTKLSKANRSLDDKARQLRRSEDRLKNAERLAHVGHWDWDVKMDELSWSEEMFRIFDVPTDFTPSYKGFVQAVIPQDRERLERWVNECLANKSGHSIEFQIARPNGDLRIVELYFRGVHG